MGKSFEENLQRLENIVDCFSNDQLSLQEGLSLMEEGIRLIKECNLFLDKGKGKLKMLLEGENGIAVWDAKELEGEIDEI
ncbi:MAG: exodeoxyribonuclease VII small subunit [Bacillota bacterium]